ncbi:MAG: universal stress protein [Rhodobacteraceae bacterium]|nr:universal stress protein [Alphaproteobacteria bacterium]MBT8476886.1 universal stress protein [Alphaproteobacteria bacterium]NNF72328.1 universal stress protein [Paracoccaceae bacterium]NNK67496.1 universal stress protein [Paracoccaceae bacterium]
MHDKILIPVAIDHEPVVAQKIEVARKLLNPGGKITLLTVLEAVSGFVAEFVTVKSENHLTQRIQSRLEEAAGGADDIDCQVITGKPGVEITRFAADEGCGLIIVGSHRPGVEDYFLGSTASRVVRRSPCSVYVLR